VINTQRMLTVNQEQYAVVWPFLEDRPQVLVDWLPWNHTFGGNNNFGMMLRNGGTSNRRRQARSRSHRSHRRELEGRLADDLLQRAPRLRPAHALLEKDAALRRSFFRDLDCMVYAGASLPQTCGAHAAARRRRARRAAPLISAWGSTETAPMATVCTTRRSRGHHRAAGAGCELKLLPAAGKLEARVKGPNVTPGYWGRDDLTKAAFDEEATTASATH